MSHTPGPWQISDDHGKRWIETLANDDTICEVHRRDRNVGRDKDEQFHANARLIAAAPELLEALQDLDALRGPFPPSDEAVESAWRKASAVIAKAIA
ncbi:hypothetical protein [Pseudomonas aeruginosa]|uniref:hypothetical protein n=1 Tax=Pseudomonas aeruginosa TaxID=287 RepID=UPI00053D5B62|nr:hypothetical protein [Pseudomonas aeruginosa]ANA73647.1 hypothetical protein A6R75_27065 [Pseudomonas aeruginosa]EJT5133598.1 hypothetical protein [Pseudomonas aeruginosa]EKU4264494.1 hypothetical protein [Pseudomonas aeruginosa]KSQ07343.1 hypothetical protein APB22_00040 [Pseudomonas aeruginosa]MBF3102350.1 hypothetical protein [Pseudomonas aeruginosa]